MPPHLRVPHDPPPPPAEGGTPTPPPTGEPGTPTPPDDGSGTPTPDPGGARPPAPRPASPTPPAGGGPGGGIATPDGPRRPTRPATGFESWEFWWGYNRDAVLDLRARLRRAAARAETSTPVVGVGRSHDRGRGRQDASEASLRGRVLPALEAATMPDRRDEIRAAAALAFAKAGATWRESTAGAASLLGFLARNERDRVGGYVEESAVLALGFLGDRDPAILDLLAGKLRGTVGSSRHARTRAFAAVALGLLRVGPDDPGHETVVEALRGAVFADGEATRDVAVCALVGTGLSEDPTFLPVLLERAGDGRRADDLFRAHALSAIGKIAAARPDAVDDAVVGAVVRALAGRGENAPRSAAIAAGPIGAAEGLEGARLAKLLRGLTVTVESGEAQASRFAMISLGRIAAARGEDAVRTPVLALLRERTLDGPDASRPFAALALGLALGDVVDAPRERAIETVRTAFATPRGDARHRGGFAIALGLLRARGAVPDLIEVLRDRREPWRLRAACAVALGLIGDPAAREPVRAAIEDPGDPRLRGDLAVAAGLLGDHEAMGRLVAILADPETSQYVQTSVTAAVGLIGDRRAVDPLVAILGDEEAAVLNRTMAAVGLGLLADGSERPAMTRISADVNYRAQVPALMELLRIL